MPILCEMLEDASGSTVANSGPSGLGIGLSKLIVLFVGIEDDDELLQQHSCSFSCPISVNSSCPGSKMTQKSFLAADTKLGKRVSSSLYVPKMETRPTLKANTVMKKEPMIDMISQKTFLMQNRMGPNRWWISKIKINRRKAKHAAGPYKFAPMLMGFSWSRLLWRLWLSPTVKDHPVTCFAM